MELGIVPIEIQARDYFGKELNPEEVGKAGEYAKDLIINRNCYISIK